MVELRHMSKHIGKERPTVQAPLIRYAEQAGWLYLPSADALSLRGGDDGLLFYRILRGKLIELNHGLITEDNADEVVRKIEGVRCTIEGNAEMLSWLRGEQTIFDPKEKRHRNVSVIDFRRLKRNLYHVTDEWHYTNGREEHQADVIFLVNGIPVALVETKSAKEENAFEKAWVQIRQYHRDTPEMLAAPQVFDITNIIGFHYGVTWNTSRQNIFDWKDEEKGNFEQKVKRFFDRERFLRMLNEWILFFVKDGELQKTILRQHQTRAIDKIIARCADKDKKTGLVWHTQGSGKTFTMITAAHHMLENKARFGKATVVTMIDRNELQGQLSGWIDRLLGELQSHDIAIELASSKARLRGLLKSDFRGLIISMIHKFDGIPKNICTRDNVFVLVDEAHRSVGGDLGNYLFGALPKATLIGFTGTPIDKTAYGKGTFKIFGKEDKHGYLDKYSIIESIEDKTTVPLKYTLAPNEIRVPREQLEREFLDLTEAEGISDIDDLNRILDRATHLKSFLKSEDRVKKVAAFVARHYTENVEPLGYKAFVVGVDREACALYKEALDRLLPPEYSMPIYSSAQHDSERYPLVHKHQVGEAEEKRVRKLFPKRDSLPKMFIVTDKLLTGFDAPVLYSMYLDKPMRDHVLLQAIARLNRPYQPNEDNEDDRKRCGLVVDFVGVFEKLGKALAFDPDIVNGVIENVDLLLARFSDLMTREARQYLDLCRGTASDKLVERAIDAFTNVETRNAFYGLYKELETLYEILSPSPNLRDHLEDFGFLSVLYKIVRSAFRRKTDMYSDVAGKTEKLVREHVEAYGLSTTVPEVILDENTLRAVKESHMSDGVKVISLINSVTQFCHESGAANPFLRPIGERAEAIRAAYDERQATTQDALRQIEQLIKDMVSARALQDKLGFDAATFAIYRMLQQEQLEAAVEYAPALSSVFQRFPHFHENAGELRQLKAEFYKFLLPLVGKERMIRIVERLLDQ